MNNQEPIRSRRFHIERAGVRLSYVDSGGAGPIVIALHGHFGCARNFAPLAGALAGSYRVIALDQRGHGWSDRPEDCSRQAYVDDVLVLLDAVSPHAPVAVLGHSLGGANAYQLAARHGERVRALIVEDIGTRIGTMKPFAVDWPRRFASLSAALDFLASQGLGSDRHFLDSLCEFEDGWGFRFDAAWIARSQDALSGDWREDWQRVQCPTLLMRGRKSWATLADDTRWMAACRADIVYAEFDGGHTIHDELPEEYALTVGRFLDSLQ